MLCNKNTVLVGKKILLVPYQIEHVAKYHNWMENEELRALTASEPLKLEQEYEMQQKWQMDEDKLTFIIIAREGDTFIPDTVNPTDPRVSSLPMVGDVNIFLSGTPLSVSESTRSPASDNGQEFTAEAEIMIAEPLYRRRGYAQEALRLMFQYATGYPAEYFVHHPRTEEPQGEEARHVCVKMPHSIPPSSLITRISDKNFPSIKLFEQLGFRITKHVEVFEEVEMRWNAHS
ncbi:GNAT domain-containing protein [Lentinula detonsa]|uniref:GNAT domain-containing protein n=1 Tax=Lentinula detonsa TaxID=2804962 RepID=A0A9W8NT31_9AGAR|nr:GNAT domain-containing protein [Lentinula detonsa]KAJ3981384.1 GNAT domain-containing protein [Lentinula detonsa]